MDEPSIIRVSLFADGVIYDCSIGDGDNIMRVTQNGDDPSDPDKGISVAREDLVKMLEVYYLLFPEEAKQDAS